MRFQFALVAGAPFLNANRQPWVIVSCTHSLPEVIAAARLTVSERTPSLARKDEDFSQKDTDSWSPDSASLGVFDPGVCTDDYTIPLDVWKAWGLAFTESGSSESKLKCDTTAWLEDWPVDYFDMIMQLAAVSLVGLDWERFEIPVVHVDGLGFCFN
jgi:hypothetical protein